MRVLLDTHVLLCAVAQSMAEPLVLLTNDSVLAEYWDGVRLD